MQTTQGNQFRSLRSAQRFLADHADRLTTVTETGARRTLDEIVAEVSAFAADQSGCALEAQGATRKQHALRQELIRHHMAPIASIARAELTHTPEIEPFHMPRGTPAVSKLVSAAHGMAKAAAPHAQLFISAGLATDFIDRLTAAADALLDVVNERAQSRGRVHGATTGIKVRLAAGRRIVHVLDTFVRVALKDEPALLASWHSVRRVGAPAGRPSHRALGTAPDAPRIGQPPRRALTARATIISEDTAPTLGAGAPRLTERSTENEPDPDVHGDAVPW